MQKICFVVQRYGIEVNGGAELECRQYAEHLVGNYDITVLTTKAIDYFTWKDEYKNEQEVINGVTVKRFSVKQIRDQDEFNSINYRFLTHQLKTEEEITWVEKQGPYVPDLIEYIIKNEDQYDVFLFMTYLYYPTVIGLPHIFHKSILIPTAHDEPFINMKIYQSIFKKAKAIFYNTEIERRFVFQKFKNRDIRNEIGGVGIDIPNHIDKEDFYKRYKIDYYIIYVGRIDESKGCNILFQYFAEYKKRNKNNLKLILIGKPVIPIPTHRDIISIGYVSDEDKINGIAGAQLLILPSKYESLSMVVLEAMSVKTPVIVNGTCDVLKEHCIKSNAGLYYNNYFEFEACINFLISQQEAYLKMQENAKKYIENNYQWEIIINRLKSLIQYVIKEGEEL